jgi:hypothetical protein
VDLQSLEARVGSPKERWDALIDRIQGEGVIRFRDVEGEWLALLWCLDALRMRAEAQADPSWARLKAHRCVA